MPQWLVLKKLVRFGLLVAVAWIAATAYWVLRPLPLADERVDIAIEPQTSVRGIAQAVVASGVVVHEGVLHAFLRASGRSRQLRAGSYELVRGDSALDLLRKLTRGEENLRAVGLIDGWTFRQFRQALDKAEGLRHDTTALTEADIMQRLGLPGVAAEGRFFPTLTPMAKAAATGGCSSGPRAPCSANSTVPGRSVRRT